MYCIPQNDVPLEGPSTSHPAVMDILSEGVRNRQNHIEESNLRRLFEKYSEDGLLSTDLLPKILHDLGIQADESELRSIMKPCAADMNFLSLDEL